VDVDARELRIGFTVYERAFMNYVDVDARGMRRAGSGLRFMNARS